MEPLTSGYPTGDGSTAVDDGNGAPALDDTQVAIDNWNRYMYVAQRGHREYTQQAQMCERMYLGAGRQWDPLEAAKLISQGRKPREFNDILPSVNSAIGHQIKNRMDISFRPRGGNADQAQADIRSKVIMQIADQQQLHWKETEVFSDGLIQQRGYFDIRMDFSNNMQGNIVVVVRDPMDVIPDPDAKTYEPTGWADVCMTRWLTKDDVVDSYGQESANAAFANVPDDQDFGANDDTGALRAKFSDPLRTGRNYDAYFREGGIQRVRVVERQRWINTQSRVLYYPRTGDFKLAENLLPEVIAQQTAAGAVMTRRSHRRVKWVASTCDVKLHNDWSPYNDFTIVPYFAFFRRGQTLGLIDNAIDPQQARNKALSNFEHILGSTANTGWKYEEGSISNMKPGEFGTKGAMTGLMIEVRKGFKFPEKIEPTAVPQGVDRYLEQVSNALKSVTVPDAMRGEDGAETSGIARQTQQFAAQQQIAIPLDNLGRTRHMVGTKLHNLSQQFMSEARTFTITETNPATGLPEETQIHVNQPDPANPGKYTNDLTEGDYDVVITEQPMATTFEDGQFNQVMEMRKNGINIPDSIAVQASSLSRKSEIVAQMEATAGAQTTPLDDAKTSLANAQALLVQAQTVKAQADAVNSDVTAMFSATQAANQIAAVPAIAPLADALLKSAGFVDKDAAPIVPNAPSGLVPAIDAMPPMPGANTSPNSPAVPATPDIGVNKGIEKSDPALGAPR